MKMKWRILTMAIIVAACVANHVEHHLRAKRIAQQAEAADVPVLQVDSSAAGHTTLSIKESGLEGSQKAGVLQFSTLEAWAFTKDAPPPCPPSVTAADGQRVKIVGFMYPLQEAASLRVFCLLRSTQTCCYGPRPQYNQYVLVETPQPVKFERLAPVVVQGTFHVDAKPDEGYIYRIDAASVRSASGNEQPPGAQEVARQANLPLFDFDVLEQIQQIKDSQEREKEIQRRLAPLDGKPIVVSGFVIAPPDRTTTTAPAADWFTVGKYPELRIPKSPPSLTPLRSPAPIPTGPLGPRPPATTRPGGATPAGLVPARVPNLYNALRVHLKTEKELPPAWWQEATFKGTLRVTADSRERSSKGIVHLEDATLATSPAGESPGLAVDAGPFLPTLYELLFLAAGLGVLIPGLLRIRTTTQPTNGGRT